MPGRVELDDIETLAARTMRLQLRRTFIRHARQFLRFWRGDVTAEHIEFVAQRLAHRRGDIHHERIGAIGVDTGPGLGLVQLGEFLFSPVHLIHGPVLAQVSRPRNGARKR
ncbi:hypothetical protein D9M70_502610 [compost metagenome]